VIASLVPIIVSVLGAGGLIGAVVALVKLRPESGQIVVTAAQGALIVQTGVIDSLRDQTQWQQARILALETDNGHLRNRVDALERNLRGLREQINGRS